MNFTIAGFYSKSEILNKLLYLYDNFPYIFKKDIVIQSLYDSLPDLKWNGGRTINNNLVNTQTVLKNIENINNLGIGINFTFSNFLIKENDLKDKKCNDILRVLSSSILNGVIVSSMLLKDYIMKHYPNLKIILSLTYFYNNINNINYEIKKTLKDNFYHKIVIPPDYNYDFNLLSNLSNKNKIELLVNETCYKNCKYKTKHYRLINEDNLNHTIFASSFCHKVHTQTSINYNLINNEDDIKRFIKLGIKNFKISGRTLEDKAYIFFLYKFLIKKEYRNLFYSYISSEYMNSNNRNFNGAFAKRLAW